MLKFVQKRVLLALIVCGIFILQFSYFVSPVYATNSCTASADITSVETSSTNTFTYTVNNTGDTNIVYVKIERPSANFTLAKISDPSGWSMSANTSQAELSGSSISPGGSLQFQLRVVAGDTEAAAAGWTMTIYGDDFTTCTEASAGAFQTAISGTADVTAPVIDQVTVKNITSSSADISWTTNEAADTYIEYDTSLSYANSNNNINASLVTTHSISLTGLTANTTYYYFVRSTDDAGNIAFDGDFNFTTSAATTTTTVVSTPTPTPSTTTTTTTASPTPTPKATDSIRPNISLTTSFTEPFEQAPLIEGTASDNNTLTNIDYSIDGGLNWQPVDGIEEPNSSSTTFSFTPVITEDGNYNIRARAIDNFNNTGETDDYVLILDRLPPEVGGNVIALGPHPLKPNANGAIISMVNLAQKITLSTVGGATSVDLFANDRMFSLGRSAETGLWSGTLNFTSPGIYQLSTRAIDGAGNETERNLNPVIVVRSGQITRAGTDDRITDGTVELYYQDPAAKVWTLWDAEAFGQQNPQKLSEMGEYQYFVPPGTYYLKVKSKGLATLTSRIFSVSDSTPINADFQLKPGKRITIGPFTFTLPDFLNFDKADLTITAPPSIVNSQFETIMEGQLPLFTLPSTENEDFEASSLIGQPAVITLFSSWAPAGVEQVSLIADALKNLEINGALVAVQENPSKVAIFKRRGNYDVPIIVDRDGTLVADYHFTSIPTHYFVDRGGDIKKVVTGVLTADEVKSHLESL